MQWERAKCELLVFAPAEYALDNYDVWIVYCRWRETLQCFSSVRICELCKVCFSIAWIDEVWGKNLFCVGSADYVMSLEVFENGEDWSCACKCVRKGWDLISYALHMHSWFLLAWNHVGSVLGSLGRLLEGSLLGVSWEPFGAAWKHFGSILGCLGRSRSVLEGLGTVLEPSWGFLEELFGVSWEILGRLGGVSRCP